MNKFLVIVCMFMAVMLYSQSAQTTVPAGIVVTGSATTAAGCLPVTGAMYTLCPVPGDGIYIIAGTGTPQKIVVGTQATGGVTSLNGKTGDLKISAVSGAPSVNASAPAVTVTVQ